MMRLDAAPVFQHLNTVMRVFKHKNLNLSFCTLLEVINIHTLKIFYKYSLYPQIY
jgi:hypothetical protein